MSVFVSQSTARWARQLDDLRQRWSIRRDEATKNDWMPVVQFERGISKLSRDELLSMKAQLIEINHGMKAQLDIARSRSASGNYSDADWYREMQQAVAAVSRHVQVVDAALSRSPRAKPKSFPGCFMDAAESILDESLFERIKREARNRMECGK